MKTYSISSLNEESLYSSGVTFFVRSNYKSINYPWNILRLVTWIRSDLLVEDCVLGSVLKDTEDDAIIELVVVVVVVDDVT